MKALYFDEKLALRNDYPIPVPTENEALIKVTLAGLCNTDKEIMNGYTPFRGILGHEFVGVVEECHQKNLIGRRVVGEINIGCGECSFCRKNMKTHCLQRKVLGIRDKDGVFAEYTTLPIANLHMVPDEIRDEEAVFTEPLAAALNILQMVDIRKQDRVVVIGDGKLGQLIVRAISTTSCDLTLIGKQKEKLALAEEFSQTRLFDKNADLQNHFDIAVDCTGNKAALLYAGAIVRPRGTIVLKSTYAGNIECNPSLWVVKELKLLGSRCGAFAPALHFMQKEKIDLTKLIEKTFFIADWKEAFETAFTKGALKVLLKI